MQAHVRLCLCNLLAASLNFNSACERVIIKAVCVCVCACEWLSNCRLQLEANYNCLIWLFLQQQTTTTTIWINFTRLHCQFLWYSYLLSVYFRLSSTASSSSCCCLQISAKDQGEAAALPNFQLKNKITYTPACVRKCVSLCVCVYCVSLFVFLFVLAKILSAAATVRSNLHWRHREQKTFPLCRYVGVAGMGVNVSVGVPVIRWMSSKEH